MVDRVLPGSGASSPLSGPDYMEKVKDSVAALWDAVALIPTNVANSGNDYTLTVDPALESDVVAGMVFFVEPNASADGPVRLRVTSSNPYYDVTRPNGAALGSGDWDAGTVYVVVFFDGAFVVVSASPATGGAQVDRQVFTADGTWNKPAFGSVALIEGWGAGAGGNDEGTVAGGGGGGAYRWRMVPLSDLGGSETVTVGQGGAGGTGGGAGGDSSFGAHLTAEGAPAYSGSDTGGDGGGKDGQTARNGATPLYGGAHGGDNSGGGETGADAIYGGAGGGTFGQSGGVSEFGGNGGAGAQNGSPPGGGGGGDGSGSPGDGARGEIRVTVW